MHVCVAVVVGEYEDRGRQMNRQREEKRAGEGVDVHFHAVQCSVAHSMVKN